MKYTFLFPDEIAEIIRTAPDGAVLTVDRSKVQRDEYEICQYYDGIFIMNRATEAITALSDFVPMVYDAIESRYPVAINGTDILTIE